MLTIGANLLLIVLAVALPILSGSFHIAVQRDDRRSAALPILALHLFWNTLNVLVIVFIAGWLHVGSIVPLRCYAMLMAAAITVALLLKRGSMRRDSWASLVTVLRESAPALVVTTVSLLPALLVVRASGNRFGFATLFNGDIANYSLVADNVAKAGFGNSGHVLNANYGAFASQGAAGGTAIINYISALSGLRSWQVLIGAMGYVIFIAFVALKTVARSVWPSESGGHAVVAAIAVMIPLSSLLVGQYFLNHLLGIGACALSLAAVVTLSRQQTRTLIPPLMLTVALALAVYVNGTFGLPFLISSAFLMPIIYFSSRREFADSDWLLRSRMAVLLACVATALVIASPSLKAAIDTLQNQSNANVGYPLDHLGALGALIWPSWIGASFDHFNLSAGWQLGSWLIALALALVLVLRSSLRFDGRIALLAIGGIALAATASIVLWGNGRYQTWKLWAFLLPIAIVVVLPALWSIRRDTGLGRTAGLIALGISATAPMATWKSEVWLPNADETAQVSLVASLRTIDKWKLGVVNINLDPYLETMIAGTVLENTRVALTSGSYISGPLTIDSTCTFTKVGAVADASTGIRLSGDYVLMPTPARCGNNLPWPS